MRDRCESEAQLERTGEKCPRECRHEVLQARGRFVLMENTVASDRPFVIPILVPIVLPPTSSILSSCTIDIS